jgi:hypothetical protein
MEPFLNERSIRNCWICGRAVRLEDCKVDEYGLAVHEECQTLKLALRNAKSSATFRAPNVSTRRPAKHFWQKHTA